MMASLRCCSGPGTAQKSPDETSERSLKESATPERGQNDPFLTHTKASERSAGQQPRKATAATPGAGYKPKEQESNLNTPLWLFIVPVLTFLVSALVFTIFWELARVFAIGFVVAAMVQIILIAKPAGNTGYYAHEILPSLVGGDQPAAVRVWLRMFLGLLAIFLGMAIGLEANEIYMRQYYAIALGREYTNVLASSPGAAYADTGKLFFAESSKVDTERAVGFKEGPTYCVAPVMDSGAAQGKTVAFWAIGINCCGERGDFTCGDGQDGKEQGGVRAAPDSLFDKDSHNFYRAARLAAAVHDLKVDEDAILLHWVEDPNMEQHRNILTALGIDVLGAALFALLVLVLDAFALRHEHTLEMQQKRMPIV